MAFLPSLSAISIANRGDGWVGWAVGWGGVGRSEVGGVGGGKTPVWDTP